MEGSREEIIMDREGEAAKQANSIKRTTEGRQGTGDPSEFARRKKRLHEKESRKCEAYRLFVAYKKRNGKDKKANGAQYSSLGA